MRPVSLKWNVIAAKDISSAQEVVHQVSAGTQYIIVDSDSEVYIRFNGVATANQIVAANDLRWPAKSQEAIEIPGNAAVSGAVYLHVKQVDSVASKTVRLIEL